MSTAWTGLDMATRLVAEVIVRDTTPCIRVKTRSGHLVGYCKDVAEVERRVTNIGLCMADVEIKEKS